MGSLSEGAALIGDPAGAAVADEPVAEPRCVGCTCASTVAPSRAARRPLMRPTLASSPVIRMMERYGFVLIRILYAY
jgi:hypothetical protein